MKGGKEDNDREVMVPKVRFGRGLLTQLMDGNEGAEEFRRR